MVLSRRLLLFRARCAAALRPRSVLSAAPIAPSLKALFPPNSRVSRVQSPLVSGVFRSWIHSDTQSMRLTGDSESGSAPGAGAGSMQGVRRTNIGIFGAMNVGKSLLMNTLTQTETSIVDSTAGTTADAKVALIELHGIGPVRLVDTPGFDESGVLGAKKQGRVRKVISESDVLLVVVDPFEPQSVAVAVNILQEAKKWESEASADSNKSDNFAPASASSKPKFNAPTVSTAPAPNHNRKVVLIVYNLFQTKLQAQAPRADQFNQRLMTIEAQLAAAFGGAAPSTVGATAEGKVQFHTLVVDLTASDNSGTSKAGPTPIAVAAPNNTGSTFSGAAHRRLCAFIEQFVKPQAPPVPLLPPMPELSEVGNPNGDSVVLLNVPMDAETPGGRLLRPQAHAQEALIRNFVSTFVYRMDLRKGRSADPKVRKAEEDRFRNVVKMLGPALKLVITDSQAIDLVHPWTLSTGSPAPKPLVPITTFSVMQINYVSGGRLKQFLGGLRQFRDLKAGSKVLICEACNHNRIIDDIGVVQIPRKIKSRWGHTVHIDFAFGREYQSKKLSDYDVVLHCGGCMLDLQQMNSRLSDLERSSDTAITNYGLVLSFFQSPEALKRVIEPYGLRFDQ